MNHATSGRPGGAWTTRPDGAPLPRSRKVEILRDEQTFGAPKVTTKVLWKRPSDGEILEMEVDVYGLVDPVTLKIPVIYSLHLICPKCGPNQPNGSSDGQMEIRCEGAGIPAVLDDNGKLWVTQDTIRCPFIGCGWAVKIEEGIAHDVKARWWSKIPW